MHRYFFEALTLVVLGGSFYFFLGAITEVGERDYVAAALQLAIGLALIATGRDLARLALLQKD